LEGVTLYTRFQKSKHIYDICKITWTFALVSHSSKYKRLHANLLSEKNNNLQMEDEVSNDYNV